MKKFAVPALLFFLAVPAYAKTTVFDWSGHVSEPNWKVAQDEVVHGTIQIDDTAPVDPQTASMDNYRAYNAAQFTFDAGGRHFASLEGPREWDVQSGYQALNNAALDTGPEYFSFNFMVNTRANKLDLLAADTLDKDWTSAGFFMEVNDPNSGKGLFGDSFAGIVDSITRRGDVAWGGGDAAPVPEPSSFALMGSALAVLSTLRRRKGNRRNRG